MHVSKRTIIRWTKDHESFADAIRAGKGVSDAKVIRSLYQRATGYEYEEEKRIIEYDKEGNLKPVRVEKCKRHVPPDVGAQCFWLKNRQRAQWADRPQETPEMIEQEQTQLYLPEKGSAEDNREDS